MAPCAPALLLLVAALSFATGACATPAATVPAAATNLLQVREPTSGKLVYVRDGNLWIWQDGQSRELTTGGTWRQPAFSPDGQEIAYVYRGENFSDLFVMAADGSSSRRLTRGQAAVLAENDWTFRPAWSPDGSRLAYIADTSSYFPVVWMIDSDGGGRRQLMQAWNWDTAADAISWSPDGKRVAVTVSASTGEASQIYLLDSQSGAFEKLTSHPQGAFDPAWSPDGGVMAYVAREGGRGELRVRRLEGDGEAHSNKLAYIRSPVWSPDGRSLAVLSAETGAFEVWIAAVDTEGEEIQIGEFRQMTRDGGIDATSGLSWAK